MCGQGDRHVTEDEEYRGDPYYDTDYPHLDYDYSTDDGNNHEYNQDLFGCDCVLYQGVFARYCLLVHGREDALISCSVPIAWRMRPPAH